MSKLAKNSVIYTIGMMIPKAAQFILLPIYTRYLSPSDYGIINSVQIINSVLVLLYTLALNRAIFRLYFDFDTDKQRKDYLGTIFIGITVSAFSITILIFSFSDLIGSIYKNIEFYPYMAISIMASAISTFFLIPRSTYFVQEKAKKFISLTLTVFFTKNIFILVLVVFLDKGVLGYLEGLLIGNTLLIPLFLYITNKQINLTFKKNLFIKSLKFSLPLLPMTLSAWIMNWIDRIFIERHFNTHDVGIYSLGYKIAMVIVIFSSSFYKAYNPYYFKTASNNNRQEAIKKLKKTNTLYLLIVIIFASLIALFSKDIIGLIFDPRYYEAYKIAIIISLSYIFGKGTGIFNLSIYQSKKTKYIMVANILGAFVNIGLNFLLIDKYGAYGAGWATVITYFFMMWFTYFFARKCFYASYNKLIVFIIFFSMLFINILFYYTELNIYFSIILKFLSVSFIAIFVYLKFKNQVKTIIGKLI